MTGKDALDIIRDLGLSGREYARLTGLNKATVSGWSQGLHPPSGSSVVMLELLQARPELIHLLRDWRG